METWITLLISIIAVGISIMAYFRDRNIELQNQIYLKKLEAFGEIISHLLKLTNLCEDKRDEAEDLMVGERSPENELKLNKLAEEIDSRIDDIRMEIGLKSIYFSDALINEIIDQMDSLYGNVNNATNPIESMDTLLAYQSAKLDILIKKMRKELGLEEMNKKLLNRIEKGRLRIDF